MSSKPVILSATGEKLVAGVPKAKNVRPFGSKILVEILGADEILGTSLSIGKEVQLDGAPQAYITALGPTVPEALGLSVGQRIFWSGKGTQVENPSCNNGRVNALLEISNILAIIEE